MKNSSVLIVDDHPMITKGVSSLLLRNRIFTIADTVSSGKEAVQTIKKKAAVDSLSKKPVYDLIIADINLPDYEIGNLLSNFRTYSPGTPILIFSMAPAQLYFQSLIESGVSGFLSKSCGEEEMLFAIKKILAGEKHFSGELVQEIIDTSSVSKTWRSKLSSRELEILALLLNGKTSKDISNLVNLHKSTVATYKSRIYQKLNINSSKEFFQWATRENLLE